MSFYLDNIDGVCFDDEYSNAPDLSNPYYASRTQRSASGTGNPWRRKLFG